jgi:hypothetical protein
MDMDVDMNIDKHERTNTSHNACYNTLYVPVSSLNDEFATCGLGFKRFLVSMLWELELLSFVRTVETLNTSLFYRGLCL